LAVVVASAAATLVSALSVLAASTPIEVTTCGQQIPHRQPATTWGVCTND
jgi:hypothetical protein